MARWVVCIDSVFIKLPDHAWYGLLHGLFMVAARGQTGAVVWVCFPPFRLPCFLWGRRVTGVVVRFLRCEGCLFLCIFRREGYSSFAVGLLWPAVGINISDVAV